MRHHHHDYIGTVTVVICLNRCTEPDAVMDWGGGLLYIDHNPCQDRHCLYRIYDKGVADDPPSVSDTRGLFEGGPDSVEWLRQQREGR